MAVIIGFGTNVTGVFDTACAVSAQWGFNANSQRLYCLGSMTPTYTIEKPTQTLSVTVYAGTGGLNGNAKVPIHPNGDPNFPGDECDSPPTYQAGVDAGACDLTGAASSTYSLSTSDWHLTGYSYNKSDALQPGQETWSLTKWVEGSDPAMSPEPVRYIRGVTEGSANLADDGSSDDGRYSGIWFISGSTIQSKSGSVSAGQQGNASLTINGTIEYVGGPTAAGGDICSGSASIPITPLWV